MSAVMTRLLVAVATVAALVAVPAASASSPYRIPSRASFEQHVAPLFVRVVRENTHRSDRVRSIGCAKSGTGRWSCVVVADDSRLGRASLWQFSLSCPTDTVESGCRDSAAPWTAAA